MAKARTEARRLGSCRPSVPRFVRAFTPPRPAGRAPRKTYTSGTSAYFRCEWGVWGVGLPSAHAQASYRSPCLIAGQVAQFGNLDNKYGHLYR